MTCKRCLDEPCDRVRATRKLLGAWARERRRQAAGLFGALADEDAMTKAVSKPVDEAFQATCTCECHDRK